MSINPTTRTAYHALMNHEIYHSKPSDVELEAMQTESKRLSKCFSDREVKQHARYAAALRKITKRDSSCLT